MWNAKTTKLLEDNKEETIGDLRFVDKFLREKAWFMKEKFDNLDLEIRIVFSSKEVMRLKR